MLQNLLYVPNLRPKLLSVGVIEAKRMSIVFNGICFIIKGTKLTAQGTSKHGSHEIDMAPDTNENVQKVACAASLKLPQDRRDHVNKCGIKEVALKNMVKALMVIIPTATSVHVKRGYEKSSRTSIRKSNDEREKGLIDLVRSDFYGTTPVKSLRCSQYFFILTDDHLRWWSVH